MSASDDALSALWPAAFDRSLPDEERLANLRALKAERERLGLPRTSITEMKGGPRKPLVDDIDLEIADLES